MTHGLPKQPGMPTVNTLITHIIIHTTLGRAMVDTIILLRTVKTMTHTATLRGTMPTTIRTTTLLWIVNTKTHTPVILPMVPRVFLCITTAMADIRTASPVTRGSVIPTSTITIQHTTAVTALETIKTIPLIGLETLTPARVVDLPGTKAANWNRGVGSRAVTCTQQQHVTSIPVYRVLGEAFPSAWSTGNGVGLLHCRL